MTGAFSRFRTEIDQGHRDMFQNSDTRNAILIMRMISKHALQMQKNIQPCVIDYTKTFDKLRYKHLK